MDALIDMVQPGNPINPERGALQGLEPGLATGASGPMSFDPLLTYAPLMAALRGMGSSGLCLGTKLMWYHICPHKRGGKARRGKVWGMSGVRAGLEGC